MKTIKELFDTALNADKASDDAIAFVNSLKVDGKIDPGLAVYALAFYSGYEATKANEE